MPFSETALQFFYSSLPSFSFTSVRMSWDCKEYCKTFVVAPFLSLLSVLWLNMIFFSFSALLSRPWLSQLFVAKQFNLFWISLLYVRSSINLANVTVSSLPTKLCVLTFFVFLPPSRNPYVLKQSIFQSIIFLIYLYIFIYFFCQPNPSSQEF